MKLVTDTVNEQAFEIIKSMLLSGRMAPGEKIDAQQIAAELGVSLMPVRNALQKLTTLGLIITRQRVGFFVREFSNAELEQIIDTRKMFELYCLQNYFDKIDREKAKHLFDFMSEMSMDEDDIVQKADEAFHWMIVDASQNAFIRRQYIELNCMFNLGMGIYSAGTPDVANVEHVTILEAILAGDKDGAYKYLCQHLDRVREEIVAQNR